MWGMPVDDGKKFVVEMAQRNNLSQEQIEKIMVYIFNVELL